MNDISNHDFQSTGLDRRKPIWLCFTIACWVAFVVIGHIRYAPPAPLSSIEAGENEFSAERADPILKTLVGDGVPHPAGSDQNKIVCRRIVELLESWGYAVTEHKTHHGLWRQADGEQIPLVNIMTRLTGREQGPAIMLVSHYDARTGPGASDNAVGTAALLEVARMMKRMPQPRNEIIFLITDGEELGLLGADKFVQEHEWAQDVGFVVNVEARGTAGPSLMFETSDDSKWLIELFARETKRPMASSLFYEIYKFLPNDTDFTIFRRAGMEGYNFAFIGDVKNYHTLEDNYENADRGSLQHHGENALALIRALGDKDLRNRPQGKAVYFDIFGWLLVWWPEHWSILMSLSCAVALFGVSMLRFRMSAEESWSSGFIAAGMVLGLLVVSFAIVYGVSSLFALDERFEIPWPPMPLPIELAYWFAATSVVSLIVAWIPYFRKSTSVWFGTCLFWLVLASLTSVYLSGASYLFVVPLIIAVVAALLGGSPTTQLKFPMAMLPIAVGIIWLPQERLFYDAIGFKMNLMLAGRIAIVLTSLTPVLAVTRSSTVRWFGWLNLVAFVVAAIVAVVLNPPFAD